jgi:RNA polymerase sigma factor (sigma-70 family)
MIAITTDPPTGGTNPGATVAETGYNTSELEAMLVANLALIGRIIRFTASRHRLSPMEADDLASVVHLRLVENDYAVLRKFKHRCRLKTFLIVVITRICLDYFAQESGRWRPSAEAQRLGTAAMEFERMIGRDQLTFEEAVVSLQSMRLAVPSRTTLSRLAAQLLVRPRRRGVSDTDLSTIPDSTAPPSVVVARRELQKHAARIRQAIGRLLRTFDPQDRQLIELHFNQGLAIAQIARRLRVEQRPLYARMARLLARLRRGLEGDPTIARVIPELLHESWNDPWRP